MLLYRGAKTLEHLPLVHVEHRATHEADAPVAEGREVLHRDSSDRKVIDGDAAQRAIAAGVAEDQVGHVDEAVEAIIKQRPNEKLDPKVLKAQIQLYMPLFATPATKGKPMGWQAEEDWASALKAMEDAGVIKPGSKPADYYTNQFIKG